MTFDEFVKITIGDPEVLARRQKVRPNSKALLYVVDELNSFQYVCRKVGVDAEGQYDDRTEWLNEIYADYCKGKYPTRWSIGKKMYDTTKGGKQVALIVFPRKEDQSFDDWRMEAGRHPVLNIAMGGFCFHAYMVEDQLHVD